MVVRRASESSRAIGRSELAGGAAASCARTQGDAMKRLAKNTAQALVSLPLEAAGAL
jgi:hypothetical protein